MGQRNKLLQRNTIIDCIILLYVHDCHMPYKTSFLICGFVFFDHSLKLEQCLNKNGSPVVTCQAPRL